MGWFSIVPVGLYFVRGTPPQPTTTVVIQQQPQSQALPALISFFLPGVGQLIQGRLLAFLVWAAIAVVNFCLMFVAIGCFTAPLLGILCVLDAATWQPGKQGVLGVVAGVIALGVVCLGGLVAVVFAFGAVTVASDVAEQMEKDLAELESASAVVESELPMVEEEETPVAEPKPTETTELAIDQSEITEDAGPAAIQEAEPTPTVGPVLEPEPEPEPETTFRTWTDSTGEHKVEAEFVSATMGQVKLRKADGSEVVLPMERLSEADQEWLR
jgi:hypothetical protein